MNLTRFVPASIAMTLFIAGCEWIVGVSDRQLVPPDAGDDSFDSAAFYADVPTIIIDDAGHALPNCRFPADPGAGKNCGPDLDTSCCESKQIEGGTYFRSYDGVSADYSSADAAATVSDFALDTFEITVGRFRAFVNAGRGTRENPPHTGSGAHPRIADSGWQDAWNTELAATTADLRTALRCTTTYKTWTDLPGSGNERLPINCLTWYEAFAFCAWDSARLPTEAEWNYAAAGGGEQRAFPWSKPSTATIIDSTYAAYDCQSRDGGCAAENIAPVGSYSPLGDGKWGHHDLAGNVTEWTLDAFDVYRTPCIDCADLGTTTTNVQRGGSYADRPRFVLASVRISSPPNSRSDVAGARCARDVTTVPSDAGHD